jgi:hypothetical protein
VQAPALRGASPQHFADCLLLAPALAAEVKTHVILCEGRVVWPIPISGDTLIPRLLHSDGPGSYGLEPAVEMPLTRGGGSRHTAAVYGQPVIVFLGRPPALRCRYASLEPCGRALPEQVFAAILKLLAVRHLVRVGHSSDELGMQALPAVALLLRYPPAFADANGGRSIRDRRLLWTSRPNPVATLL